MAQSWTPGRPTTNASAAVWWRCGTFVGTNNNTDRQLTDLKCSDPEVKYYSFCTKPVGYFEATGNGIFYKIIHKKTTSFAEAKALCVRDGAVMAIFYGPPAVRAIGAVRYIETDLTTLDGYWVDGTDEAQEGIWVMANGLNFIMAI